MEIHPDNNGILTGDGSSSTLAAPAAAIVNEGRVVASGYAKKLAGERGVDLRTVAGTGPNGRITADDVEASPGGAYVHVPAAGVVAADYYLGH